MDKGGDDKSDFDKLDQKAKDQYNTFGLTTDSFYSKMFAEEHKDGWADNEAFSVKDKNYAGLSTFVLDKGHDNV